MKFRLWEIIVLISLIVLAIIFSAIYFLWDGFKYFTAVSIITFVGFFINNRFFYIGFLKKEYENGLDTYFAELFNNNYIDKEQFENRDERIINGYYKEFKRTKNVNILIIVGLILISLSLILDVFRIW